jgi:hypothetical protein
MIDLFFIISLKSLVTMSEYLDLDLRKSVTPFIFKFLKRLFTNSLNCDIISNVNVNKTFIKTNL